MTEYLFRNPILLEEALDTAIDDHTFRSDDLEFTFAARVSGPSKLEFGEDCPSYPMRAIKVFKMLSPSCRGKYSYALPLSELYLANFGHSRHLGLVRLHFLW